MYICVIVSTVEVNDCIFCVNEQQKVYCPFIRKLFRQCLSAFFILLFVANIESDNVSRSSGNLRQTCV